MAKAVFALVLMGISNTLGKINRNIEGLVVEGSYADIKDFGYAAYLRIHCEMDEEVLTNVFSCGSSILNQDFLLTAAHCVVDCRKSSFIAVNAGSENKREGIQRSSSKFVAHVNYGFPSMENDIGLIKLKASLEFGDKIYRIVLMKNPPNEKVAMVAGWGLTNEFIPARERYMKYTKQRLWSRSDCQELIEDVPMGAFCAGEQKANSYASFGDSGGPLVIAKSIQVGIVSYKSVDVSRSLAVYTNVSHYIDWIQHTTKQLNC